MFPEIEKTERGRRYELYLFEARAEREGGDFAAVFEILPNGKLVPCGRICRDSLLVAGHCFCSCHCLHAFMGFPASLLYDLSDAFYARLRHEKTRIDIQIKELGSLMKNKRNG